MKRILYIHHTAGWGGSANSLVNLISSLNPQKYSVEVLLLKKSDIAEKLEEHRIKYRVASSAFYKRFYVFFPHSEAGYVHWYQVFQFFKLLISWLLSRYYFASKELARHEFSIAHLNTSVLTDWLAPAKKQGVVIMHLREPFRKGRFDFLHPIFRAIIKRNADKVVAISNDNSRRLNLPEKTIIVYNSSEVPQSEPSENSYKSMKVLYLGGSSTSKGFYTLVQALDYLDEGIIVYFGGKYVSTKNPDTLFQFLKFFLSNARRRNNAIRKIEGHPNAKVVGMTKDTASFFLDTCCLVSPFEVPHFSRPVIEAHLNRKPAIGTDVDGMEEIIVHNFNGMIIPKNDPLKLATAINEIVKDSDRAKILGENGYRVAIQRFTNRNTKEVEAMYDELKWIGK